LGTFRLIASPAGMSAIGASSDYGQTPRFGRE
jgi:hypothetical protein